MGSHNKTPAGPGALGGHQPSPGLKMALVPCIAISTGYILLIMFLCELLRKAVAPLNDGLVKTALNEAIAAADLCGVSLSSSLLLITTVWRPMACTCSLQPSGGLFIGAMPRPALTTTLSLVSRAT